MKNYFLCLAVLCMVGEGVMGQQPFREWTDRFSSPEVGDQVIPATIVITKDSGYMVTTENNSSDLSLLKFSATGSLEWSEDFSATSGGAGTQLSDGGYVATGGGAGGILLVRTDSAGNELWANSYSAGLVGNWTQQTLDGGLITGGYFQADGGYDESVIIKTDINGHVQWSKQYTISSAHLIVHTGVQLSDSSYVMACNGGYGLMLFKTDKNGNLLWIYHYNITGYVLSYTCNMRPTADGGFIMVGTDPTVLWHVIKVNAAGTVQWSKEIYPVSHPFTTAYGYCYDVQPLDYGYALAGMYYDTLGYSASYLVKTDPNGNLLWGRSYTEPYWNSFHSLKQTADKGLVIYGEVQVAGSIQHGDLVKTDSLGEGVCTYSTVAMADTDYTPVVNIPDVAVSAASSVYTTATGTGSGSAVLYPSCAGPPVAAFTANNTQGCSGLPVIFTDQSANQPTGWSWTFAGGTPDTSTQQNPTVIYYTPGVYPVKLVVSNINGADSLTKTAYITVSGTPGAGTIIGPDAVCEGSAVQLQDTGSTGSLQWKSSTDGILFTKITGDTSAISNDTGLTETTYFEVAASGNCPLPDSSPVFRVVVNPVPVAGTITGPAAVCAESAALLSDSGSTGSIRWQFSVTGSSFTTMAGDTLPADSLTGVAQTTYYRVLAGNGCGSDSSPAFKLVVNPLPAPFVITPDSLICSGDSTEVCTSDNYLFYRWNTGDSTFCTMARSSGGYWVTVTDSNRCVAISGQQEITVYPVPSVSIEVQGDTLSSFGQVSYQWLLNSEPLPADTGTVCIAHQPGMYSVQVTDTNGCTTISQTVLVTGIENLAEESISVYPNPSSAGSWQLAVGNGWMGSALEMYDDNGRLVFKSEIRELQSEIALDVPGGVYYLRISNEQGSIIKKLIKL